MAKKIIDERYRNVNKRKKKKKSSLAATLALVFAAIFILGAVGGVTYYFWIYKPNQQLSTVPGEGNDSKPDAVPAAIEKLSDVDGAFARKDGVRNFLIVGEDEAGLNTDVIMVASYDTVNNSVSIMQFPRDTYCEIDGAGYKFNSMFAKYYLESYNSGSTVEEAEKYGMEHLKQIIQDNLTVKIDYYLLVNLEGFIKIINDINGVDMYVPYALQYEDYSQTVIVDGVEMPLVIDIQPGQQTLYGYAAMGFVRYRYGYINADLGREDAQKMFLTALFEKVKNGNGINAGNVASIVSDVIDNTVTDIPTNDFIFIVKKLFDISLENVTMFTAPGNACMVNGVSYYVISRYDTTRLVNKYLNVYTDVEINDTNFDVNTVFAAEYITNVQNIYYRETTNDLNTLVYTASGVQLNGIDIPLL